MSEKAWGPEVRLQGKQFKAVIFLKGEHKLRTPEDIDSLLSAEFPNEEEQPELFELVKKFMVYTPCGPANPTAPVRGHFYRPTSLTEYLCLMTPDTFHPCNALYVPPHRR